ncbi:plant intracellular Ras-group-related LRR protein 7 isoform X2 [Glycine soja]|uniref:plant intracellular Ras-group-related LRR protein 7 isoform X2 n=1 Tax=Glycine soja TaxID=3848 RepID=UPI0003DEC073|nr:plant intracellular Ras-group-related LRR protein 7 isoform X2 [Glycine soja]|eukprot:XP_006582002.1 plant intracellular Ras-group-related LRR protein 7 isoform X2 [Glycine max]
MGCFASKNADTKASRAARWRSTGIVALRDSKLKTFPDEILELDRSVRTLDLTHNRIVDIPVEISKLINVQRLILAENLIERLPVNLGKLQSLKLMNLDGNRITSLPDELGQLVRLERISISGNLLTSLPATIGSLRNLVLLNVSNNKLQSLPESVGSCFSLEELQANDNLIEDLPSSVCNLSHLKSLCLDNNNVKQEASTSVLEIFGSISKTDFDPSLHVFISGEHSNKLLTVSFCKIGREKLPAMEAGAAGRSSD